MKRSIVAIATLLLCRASTFGADPPAFELLDGDRVVLIGGTLIERDQSFGYLETRLTRRYPDRSITFRNLGWSGDTVEGISQAGFGSPADGFKHLVDHVLALKPTVILLGYGANESFEGPGGLPKFLRDLDKLLKAIEPTKARLVFLSPTRQEDLGPPLPDPTRHNADLALYRDALKGEAERRGAVFVDLFELLPAKTYKQPFAGPALTRNGIHFTDFGYWVESAAIEKALFAAKNTEVGGGTEGGEVDPVELSLNFATKLEELKATPTGARFKLLDAMLPGPNYVANPFERIIQVSGLKPGYYSLKVDGKVIEIAGPKPGLSRDAPTVNGKAVRTADAWKSGVSLSKGPEFDQSEALRAAINAKNELYFYRWRPQNETYLFGFRKHEQGQNAREIPQFDPLVAAKEAEIAKLRVPVPHVYELTREGEVGR